MRPIAKIARRNLRTTPEFKALQMPKRRDGPAFAASARGMAEAAADALMRQALRGNEALLATWKGARAIHRRPGGGSVSTTPSTSPATPTSTPANTPQPNGGRWSVIMVHRSPFTIFTVHPYTSAPSPLTPSRREWSLSRYVRDSRNFAPPFNNTMLSPPNQGCTSTTRSRFTM